MWTCPDCGRTFAATRQVLTCRPLGHLDDHFARSAPQVRATFDRVVDAVRELGPVEVLAETSRIALHAFRLHAPAEVDDESRGWLAEAYEVGRQRHRR